MQITSVSINWAKADKLAMVSLCQELVQLLGDVYTLAVSNTLILLGSQTIKGKEKKGNGGAGLICMLFRDN